MGPPHGCGLHQNRPGRDLLQAVEQPRERPQAHARIAPDLRRDHPKRRRGLRLVRCVPQPPRAHPTGSTEQFITRQRPAAPGR